MANVFFDFYFGDDNKLEVEAEVTRGAPARLNCLPEDAEPAEDDEVEITSVYLVTEDDGRAEFFPEGIFIRPWGSTKIVCLEDAIAEAASEKATEI
tara:strand:- start:1764 stop:2051 length:288 start_codon:yes stop_codon:yes gene_type:complete